MDSEGKTLNWTEAVEDLIEEGETEKAISLLETLISKLEKGTQKAASFSSSDELVNALLDLSKLYSSKGFSLKADQTRQRALRINQESQENDVLFRKGDLNVVNGSISDVTSEDSGHKQDSSGLLNDSSPTNDGLEEDWEAIADRAPDELLSPQCFPEVSQLSLEDTPQIQGPKRRGRGPFSYGKRSLYSDDSVEKADSQSDEEEDTKTKDFTSNWEAIADRPPDELLSPQCLPEVSQLSLEDTPQIQGPKRRGRGPFSYGSRSLYSDDSVEKADAQSDEEEDTKTRDFTSMNYGTSHVVVVSGFSPSTKTIDLEKLFDKFKDRGFAIRWVNDTVALAVFTSPSTALEACTSIGDSRFTVRQLDEDDELLNTNTKRVLDLEPPRPRPKTSARTARRLIAQSMGVKLPSSTFSSRELRQQEAARKDRIISRQNMRDDAWGAD